MGFGRWLRRWRARAGNPDLWMDGALCGCLVLPAAYVVGTAAVPVPAEVWETHATLLDAAARVQAWVDARGELPPSLEPVYAPAPPPRDAWGHPAVYERPGPEGRAFDVVSRGADGRPDGEGPAADLRASGEVWPW